MSGYYSRTNRRRYTPWYEKLAPFVVPLLVLAFGLFIFSRTEPGKKVLNDIGIKQGSSGSVTSGGGGSGSGSIIKDAVQFFPSDVTSWNAHHYIIVLIAMVVILTLSEWTRGMRYYYRKASETASWAAEGFLNGGKTIFDKGRRRFEERGGDSVGRAIPQTEDTELSRLTQDLESGAYVKAGEETGGITVERFMLMLQILEQETMEMGDVMSNGITLKRGLKNREGLRGELREKRFSAAIQLRQALAKTRGVRKVLQGILEDHGEKDDPGAVFLTDESVRAYFEQLTGDISTELGYKSPGVVYEELVSTTGKFFSKIEEDKGEKWTREFREGIQEELWRDTVSVVRQIDLEREVYSLTDKYRAIGKPVIRRKAFDDEGGVFSKNGPEFMEQK